MKNALKKLFNTDNFALGCILLTVGIIVSMLYQKYCDGSLLKTLLGMVGFFVVVFGLGAVGNSVLKRNN